MNDRINYSLKIGLLIGVLGGLVFFIWSSLNNTISYSVRSGIIAFFVFSVLGFILGMLIYHLE